jgi:hypothetical protein
VQFKLAAKLSPLLPKLLPAFSMLGGDADDEPKSEVSGDDKKFDAADFATFATALQPAADALAAMPDADQDVVLAICLGSVELQQGKSWAPIWNKQINDLQFQDIELPLMLQLVWTVIGDSLGSFFPASR